MGKDIKIAFIGKGELGEALGAVLAKREQREVCFWDKNPKKLSLKISFRQAVEGAKFVFLAVPSFSVREVLEKSVSFCEKEAIFITLSKGIETKTGKTMPQVCEDILGKKYSFCHLSGPMLAEELKENLPTLALVASEKKETALQVKKLFEETSLGLEIYQDIYELAWAGVLKNIYAIGLGISDGLKLGLNAKGLLLGKAILEIKGLLEILTGKKSSFLQPILIGDLIATSASNLSANYRVGYEIGFKKETQLKSEGLVSLAKLIEILGDSAKGYPFLRTIERILLGNKEPLILRELIKAGD